MLLAGRANRGPTDLAVVQRRTSLKCSRSPAAKANGRARKAPARSAAPGTRTTTSVAVPPPERLSVSGYRPVPPRARGAVHGTGSEPPTSPDHGSVYTIGRYDDRFCPQFIRGSIGPAGRRPGSPGAAVHPEPAREAQRPVQRPAGRLV